jgi:KaiC/GvpD/RAD55 family RecA-like ATPase
MNGKEFLRFGIPGLDDLFGAASTRVRSRGIALNAPSEPAIITIIGPVGSGKSLLALHLASRYLADHLAFHDLKAIYLSTDLTYHRADKTWKSFRLNYPNLREIPFYGESQNDGKMACKIPLEEFDPLAGTIVNEHELSALAKYLRSAPSHHPTLGLVDFINKPVGDAWGFASRVLGALQDPKPIVPEGNTAKDHTPPRHLVIVDTVEGFESIVGERDDTGEESTLRARIERLIHASREKCHLVFVAEERSGDHPLTHIADVLIRIRAEQDKTDDYRIRTLEVEKARGQAIERGQHHMLIRTGRGSTTGSKENPNENPKENPDDPRTSNAYVMVVPSLHALNRRVMSQTPALETDNPVTVSKPNTEPSQPPSGNSPTPPDQFENLRPATESADTCGAAPNAGTLTEGSPAPRLDLQRMERQEASHASEVGQSNGQRKPVPPNPRHESKAGFGIPYLDEMLGGDITQGRQWSDVIGLQHGTLAAVLGDPNSQKTAMGHQFLLRGFELFAERLADRIAPRFPPREPSSEEGFWAGLQRINTEYGAGWTNEQLSKSPDETAVISMLTSHLYHKKIDELRRKALGREKFLKPGADAERELQNRVEEIESCLPEAVKAAPIYKQIVSYEHMSLALIDGDWPNDPEKREGLEFKLKRFADLAGDHAQRNGRRVNGGDLRKEFREIRNGVCRTLSQAPELCHCLSDLAEPNTEFEDLYSKVRSKALEEISNDAKRGEPFLCATDWPENPGEKEGLELRLKRFADAAVYQAHRNGRRIDVRKLLREFREIRNKKITELAKAEELCECLSGLAEPETKFDDLYAHLRNKIIERIKSRDYRFSEILKQYHPYGVDRLHPATRATFEKAPAGGEEKMSAADLCELACCIAISSLRHNYRRRQNNPQKIKDFLAELYPSVATDLESLLKETPNAEASPALLAAVAANPTPLLRHHDTNKEWSAKDPEKWNLDDPASFNRKLLEEFFLPSHPFTDPTDKKAMENPIVIKYVLVATVLQLWRSNVIRRTLELGTDDEEIEKRFKAASDLDTSVTEDADKSLPNWLSLFAVTHTPESRREDLRAAWNQFVDHSGGDLIRTREWQKKWQGCLLLLVKAARRMDTEDEHPAWGLARGLEDWIRREQAEYGPCLLVTTGHETHKIRPRYAAWLRKMLEGKQLGDDLSAVEAAALDHFDRWMVIRRLEVHYIPVPTLLIIVRRCLETTIRVLKPEQPRGSEYSWQTRFVIDGLSDIRATYPQVDRDPLFLPALKSYLEQKGVTGLILSSQPGTPLSSGDDGFQRMVADMLSPHIRTWRVFFYGEPRVAVTVLPSSTELGRTPIRQLSAAHDGIRVDRNFELFAGLDKGAAKQVGLDVRLVARTQGSVPYFEELQKVMSDVFVGPTLSSGEHAPQIVQTGGQDWIERLRNFCKLKIEDHAEDTIVMQLDEYWSFQRAGALRSERRYLEESCIPEDHLKNDPMDFFQATLAEERSEEIRRKDRFDWIGYFRGSGDGTDDPLPWTVGRDVVVDRIPFYWDFGFLLCDSQVWKNAETEPLHIWNSNKSKEKEEVFVGDIWRRSRRIECGRIQYPNERERLVSWRQFAEATKNVGALASMRLGQHAPAFDMPIRSGESVSCLVLEVWASEVYAKYKRESDRHACKTGLLPILFGRFTRRSWSRAEMGGLLGLLQEPEGKSLKTLYFRALSKGELPRLHHHSMELFKATLLLCEILDLPTIARSDDPWSLNARGVQSHAVSARHWFGTAYDTLSQTAGNLGLTAMRLPGHFSVRGDWYLGVAQGSQSYLLGDRALDLLSSRRGNVERLQQGLGLPVRKVSRDGSGLRTPLFTTDENGRRDWIRYKELVSLGSPEVKDWEQKEDFHWLWRSSLGDYDAQSRTFQRAVAWIVQWWHNMAPIRGTGWTSGFDLYDAIERYEACRDTDPAEAANIFEKYFDVPSLWEFPAMMDDVVNGLRRSTPRSSKD